MRLIRCQHWSNFQQLNKNRILLMALYFVRARSVYKRLQILSVVHAETHTYADAHTVLTPGIGQAGNLAEGEDFGGFRWPVCIQNKKIKSVRSLCTLYLHACQVRVTVGDSGFCCPPVMYFER